MNKEARKWIENRRRKKWRVSLALLLSLSLAVTPGAFEAVPEAWEGEEILDRDFTSEADDLVDMILPEVSLEDIGDALEDSWEKEEVVETAFQEGTEGLGGGDDLAASDDLPAVFEDSLPAEEMDLFSGEDPFAMVSGEAYALKGTTLYLYGALEAGAIDLESIGGAQKVEAIVAEAGSSLNGDCSGLFEGLSNLKRADLSRLDASDAEDLSRLFAGCVSLTECNLSGFSAEYCQSISGMFRGCTSLQSLDLSSWTATYMEDASYVFDGCAGLRKVLLPKFQGALIVTMKAMFQGCVSLSDLDATSLDTSFVQDFSEVFKNCQSLVSLDLSGFGMGEMENAASAFEGCDALVDVLFPLDKGDGAKVRNAERMFAGCKSLEELSLPDFSGALVSDKGMFSEALSLKRLTLIGDYTVRESACLERGKNGWALLTDPSRDISGKGSYAVLSVEAGQSRTFSRLENIEATYRFEEVDQYSGILYLGTGVYNRHTIDFSICKKKSFDVKVEEGARVTLVGDCSHMFENQRIDTIELEKMDFSQVTDLSYFFKGCGGLKRAVFNQRDILEKLTSCESMFEYCTGLWEIVLPRVVGGSLENMKRMFYFSRCASFDGQNFDTRGVTDMSECFSNFRMWNSKWEPGHVALDLRSWDLQSQPNCTEMFAYAQADIVQLPDSLANCGVVKSFFSNSSIKAISGPSSIFSYYMIYYGLSLPMVGWVEKKGYEGNVNRTFWVRSNEASTFVKYVDAEGKVTTAFVPQKTFTNKTGLPKEGLNLIADYIRPWYALEVAEGAVDGIIFDQGASLEMFRDVKLKRNSLLSLYVSQEDYNPFLYIWKVFGEDETSVLEVNGGDVKVIDEGCFEKATLRIHGGSTEVCMFDGTLELDWKRPGTVVKMDAFGSGAKFNIESTFVSLKEPGTLITQENIRKYLPGGIQAACLIHFDTQGIGKVADQVILVDGKNVVKEPQVPDTSRYTFGGWYRNGVPYDFSTPVGESGFTLTAQWIEKKSDLDNSFTSFALSLDGELSLYFYLNLPGKAVDYQNAYMTFMVNGATQRVRFAAAEHLEGTLYGFPCKLSVAEMADEITAIFHLGNDTAKLTYSLQDYLTYFRENQGSFDAKTLALVEALSDYGHYCQIYLSKFNGWTIGGEHAAMSAVHSLDQGEMDRVKGEVASFEDRREGEKGGKICYTLTLRSKPTLTVFYPVGENSPEAMEIQVSALVDGRSAALKRKVKDGELTYYLTIEDIPAKDCGVLHEVSFKENGKESKIFLGPLSYVQMELDPAFTHGQEGMLAVTSFYRYYEAVLRYMGV